MMNGGLRGRPPAAGPPYHTRLSQGDAEWGKRDDDYDPMATPVKSSWDIFAIGGPRYRRKRLLSLLAVLLGLWLFMYSLPAGYSPVGAWKSSASKPNTLHGSEKEWKESIPPPNRPPPPHAPHNPPPPAADGGGHIPSTPKQPPPAQKPVDKSPPPPPAQKAPPAPPPQPPTKKPPTKAPPPPADEAEEQEEEEEQEPAGAPPRAPGESFEAEKNWFNGPVRFFKLAATLFEIGGTRGREPVNRNVLFTLAHLRSASVILPMACEMAQWDRNFVHIAFMGRSELPIEEIFRINGIERIQCNVFVHDARPDYAAYSSESRLEFASNSALGHIDQYMHPQVIIMDGAETEEWAFRRGVNARAARHRIPVIEIPTNKADTMNWLTRLDSGALRAWHTPSIDVLIHAPTGSSGSLVKLLKSLERADYSGLRPPRLTIEMPPDIDAASTRFLDSFAWPPAGRWSQSLQVQNEHLTLRHRIPRERLSAEGATLHLLEAFYPATLYDSHVLLLAPNLELSPSYYQYLYYNLLEYQYSSYRPKAHFNVSGISLISPTMYLNGTAPFVPPVAADLDDARYRDDTATPAPFLWQAPDTLATLWFGDKWSELHSFITNRLAAMKRAEKKGTTLQRAKLMPESEPTWAEYVLEIMRARAWAILYPSLGARSPSTGETSPALSVIHKELQKLPEEFDTQLFSRTGDLADPANPIEPPEILAKDTVLASHQAFTPPNAEPADLSPDRSQPLEASLLGNDPPISDVLPFDGDLLESAQLPYLDYDGTLLQSHDPDPWTFVPPAHPGLPHIRSASEAYSTKFREEIGGCTTEETGRERRLTPGSARDLFCWGPGDDYVVHEIELPVQEPKEMWPTLPKKHPGSGGPLDGAEDPLAVFPGGAGHHAAVVAAAQAEGDAQSPPAGPPGQRPPVVGIPPGPPPEAAGYAAGGAAGGYAAAGAAAHNPAVPPTPNQAGQVAPIQQGAPAQQGLPPRQPPGVPVQGVPQQVQQIQRAQEAAQAVQREQAVQQAQVQWEQQQAQRQQGQQQAQAQQNNQQHLPVNHVVGAAFGSRPGGDTGSGSGLGGGPGFGTGSGAGSGQAGAQAAAAVGADTGAIVGTGAGTGSGSSSGVGSAADAEPAIDAVSDSSTNDNTGTGAGANLSPGLGLGGRFAEGTVE